MNWPPGIDVPEHLVRAIATYHGLDADLVLAVIAVEVGDGVLVSDERANGFRDWGLMQVNEGTLRAMSSPYASVPAAALLDPAIGICLGCKILAYESVQSHGDISLALARYTGGELMAELWPDDAPSPVPEYVALVLERRAAFRAE